MSINFLEPQDGDFQKLAEGLVNQSETNTALQKMGNQPQLDQTTALVRENIQASIQQLHSVNANATVTTFANATATQAAAAQAKASQETLDFTQPPQASQVKINPATPINSPVAQGNVHASLTNTQTAQVNAQAAQVNAYQSQVFMPNGSSITGSLNSATRSTFNAGPNSTTRPIFTTNAASSLSANQAKAAASTRKGTTTERRQTSSVPRPSQVAHALHQQSMTASQRAHALHTAPNANLNTTNTFGNSIGSTGPNNTSPNTNNASSARAQAEELYRINGLTNKKAWSMLIGTVTVTLALSLIIGGILGDVFHLIITWPFYIVVFFILLFPVAAFMYRNMKLPPNYKKGNQTENQQSRH